MPRSDLSILIVDDEPQSARVLERIVRDGGWGRVRATTRSGEVKDLVGAERPDVLLVDLAMPEPNGFALLEELSDEVAAGMRAVVLTGHEHPSITARSERLGASRCLPKSLARDALLAELDAIVDA